MKSILFSAGAVIGLGVAAVLSGCGGGGGGGGGDGAGPFAFSTQAPASFVRVDRMGQPALATALLSPTTPAVDAGGNPINPGNQFNSFNNQRDAFNRGEPARDATDFAGILTTGPQRNSLRKYHFELGPQLDMLGLTRCSTDIVAGAPGGETDVDISVCVAQVAPVVLPDVITFNFAAPSGWPNGRGFDDRVVDRLLAASLLRLAPGGPHTITSLEGVLNPPGDESGTPSPAAFPHLRPANPFP